METLYITEQLDIDNTINSINELVIYYCDLFSYDEDDAILLRNPVRRAICLALNEYMQNDLNSNFIYYVGPFVKVAVNNFKNS